MFKLLGQGFMDVFRKPLGLVWAYILMVLSFSLYGVIYEYTYQFVSSDNVLVIAVLLNLIKNYFWLVLIYIILYLVIIYLISLLIVYILNSKSGLEKKFLGVGKVFGFTLFLTIIGILPSFIFNLFNFSLTLSLIYILISLFYVFFLFPILLCVPILLVKNDLKYSLSESFEFSKKYYGWIVLLQFLIVIGIMILSRVLDYLSVYLTEFVSVLIFLIIIVILFLWAIHFISNWYNAEKK